MSLAGQRPRLVCWLKVKTAAATLENRASAFVTTRWTVVLTAQGSSPAAHDALEQLCRSYWRPIYAFLRREGRSPEDAQDLTQSFFCSAPGARRFRSCTPGER